MYELRVMREGLSYTKRSRITDTSDYAVGDKDPIETAFEDTVNAYQNIDKAQDDLDAVEKDINQLLSGNSQSSQSQLLPPQQQSQLPES
jgi:hypothetical protein